jgi:hypothetical protein
MNLLSLVPDLDDWPQRWMGFPKDILPGQQIVAFFRPFLEHLLHQNLSPATVRKHATNLWLLGGEIIRDLNDHPSLRKKPVETLVRDAVAQGCFLLHGDADEQQSLDGTCRKFHRFLQQQMP